MCPNKKLKWFETNDDWRGEDVTEVGRIVRLRWEETYKGGNGAAVSTTQQNTSSQAEAKKTVHFINIFLFYELSVLTVI
jgi:hypothetical protein